VAFAPGSNPIRDKICPIGSTVFSSEVGNSRNGLRYVIRRMSSFEDGLPSAQLRARFQNAMCEYPQE
jgi:hypothetical protein